MTFLAGKRPTVPDAGFRVAPDELHADLLPHQRAIVAWALRKGRCAVWADTGLGKAFIALEWSRQLLARGHAKRVLILAPLAVAQQFVREGTKWGVPVTYARDGSQAIDGVTVSNYERLHLFDASTFEAVVLDESSVLKAFTGETKRALVKTFRNTRYRLCCTATPAPNDIIELCNHADFLSVMTQQEMLAKFFTPRGSDDGSTGQYRLKSHAHRDFYRWLASWAIACKLPSDLGYPDDGYVLPALSIEAHFVAVDWAPDGHLFFTELKGVTERAKVRRTTVDSRVEAAVQIVNAEPAEQWLLWYGRLDEARGLAKALPDVEIVQGSDSVDRKEDLLRRFADGEVRVLITHPSIAGFGLNFQSCARMAFVGLSDSYESYYQSIRRSWRFGQVRPVTAHIVLTEPERAIYNNVLRKEQEAGVLTRELVAAMAEFEVQELRGETDYTDVYDPVMPMIVPAWLTTTTGE
jgi:superfamily II DNA or RNA helicase